jgi:hypothetical protein
MRYDNKIMRVNYRYMQMSSIRVIKILPTTVVVRSKAWTVFACSKTGVVVSNPTLGIDVCFYSVFVLSCVRSGLATD